jgi:hypothetical protein
VKGSLTVSRPATTIPQLLSTDGVVAPSEGIELRLELSLQRDVYRDGNRSRGFEVNAAVPPTRGPRSTKG